MKLLRDLSTRHMLTVTPSNSLRHAARLMSDREVGSAVVIDKGEVAGIVTERDVLHAAGRGNDFDAVTVADVMTTDVVAGDPGWDVLRALRTMNEGGFRHLLLVEDGDPSGVVSLRDLMTAMADMVAEAESH